MQIKNLPDKYPAGAATRIAGVSYQTLNKWAKTGFIEPSLQPADGQGSERLYSLGDLLALSVAKLFRQSRIAISCIAGVAEFVKNLDIDPDENKNADLLLLVSADGQVCEYRDKHLVAMMSDLQEQVIHVVALQPVAKGVIARCIETLFPGIVRRRGRPKTKRVPKLRHHTKAKKERR